MDIPDNGVISSNPSVPISIGSWNRDTKFLLSEFLILNETLNEFDRLEMEGYLAHKWNLVSSLPVDHTFSSVPPTDYAFSVYENQSIGYYLGNVQDLISGTLQNLSYALVNGAGSDGNSLFTLDLDGNLSSATSFDYENSSIHSIRVKATDNLGDSKESVIRILVQDLKEPVNGGVSIIGNASIGQSLTVVDSLVLPPEYEVKYEWLKDGFSINKSLRASPGIESKFTYSSDRKFAYSTDKSSSTVRIYSVDPNTRVLSFVSSVSEGTNGIDALKGINQLFLSPDESFLYTISPLDDCIAWFKRNSDSGMLEFEGSVRDGVDGVDGLDGGGNYYFPPNDSTLYIVNSPLVI